MNQDVSKVYNSYPEIIRYPLLEIRRLIFDVAGEIKNIGKVEESLKWGQPTYTVKSGTPIRLGQCFRAFFAKRNYRII